MNVHTQDNNGRQMATKLGGSGLITTITLDFEREECCVASEDKPLSVPESQMRTFIYLSLKHDAASFHHSLILL